jgi:hypothetical protein
MLNKIWACPLATMVAETASIVVSGSPEYTIRLHHKPKKGWY